MNDEMTNEGFWHEAGDWALNEGLTIVGILIGAWVLRRFGNILISRAIRRAIQSGNYKSEQDEKQREDTLISIITATLRVAVWVVSAMMILTNLGVDTGPLLASVSVVGFALGFGAQSVVKDFLSGLFIIAENQYRVGDVVSLGGNSGTVEAITMRETILRDLDGHVHHIPNGSIDVATNMTMEYSNVNMAIGVSYDADINKVEKTINEVGEALAADEEWSEFIIDAPKFLRVNEFQDSAVEIKILGKVLPGKQWGVAGEYRRRLKVAFDKKNIEIPFPQLVTHAKK